MEAIDLPGRQPLKQLKYIFCAWKILLLLLAAFCPGPGYDTSALILLDPSTHRHQNFRQLTRYKRLVLNLFRWDGFYFAKSAQRGHILEQEWAFSWAYSKLLRWTAEGSSGQSHRPLQYYIVAGIVLSNLFHFISVLVLYQLSAKFLVPREQRHIAFVASVLHILTPASLFYCAPYAEALFSLLNLLGMFCYAESKAMAKDGGSPAREDAYKVLSGFIFASATLFRSNGLLNGVIYLYDIMEQIRALTLAQVGISEIRRFVATCLAGLSIAIGFTGPQYLAYREYCVPTSDADVRPWCKRNVPSIYSWVQSHYWNVGIFRYWTLPNLPLFLLAAPMLWMLLESGATFLRHCFRQPLHENHDTKAGETAESIQASSEARNLPELVLPQLMLGVLATSSFHVQIVNRIASAYPIWYVMTATRLVGQLSTLSFGKTWFQPSWVVRGLIMYALIQGMLFANFLPPA